MHQLRAQLCSPNQSHQELLIHVKTHKRAPPSLAQARSFQAQIYVGESLPTGSQKSQLLLAELKLM
jgi:hypothetical protein